MTITPGRLSVSWDPSDDGVSLILSTSGVRPDSLPKVFQVMADLFGSGLVPDSLKDLEQLGIDCESDRETQGIGSSEESDLDEESDRIGSRNRIESDRIGSDEVFLTCPEIAAAVGVSAQAVHKRSKAWIGGRKRNARGGGMEYPISALPQDWQLQVFDYVSIGD